MSIAVRNVVKILRSLCLEKKLLLVQNAVMPKQKNCYPAHVFMVHLQTMCLLMPLLSPPVAVVAPAVIAKVVGTNICVKYP
jgi:hypothetical protein